MQYIYDESGVTFYYFLLSTLAILLVPSTIFVLFNHNKNVTGVSDIRTKKYIKQEVASRRLSRKSKIIIIGWALLALVAYQIKITPPEINNEVWDPYQILQIDSGSDLKQIKKKYRKLSLKFHPDKIQVDTEEEKVEADNKFIELSKAYRVLTDDDARKNYEEYGHPDGRQSLSLGIALPQWLVEAHNSYWVLSVYGILFGILLPFYVAKWWYKSLKYNKMHIRYKTMATMFKNIKPPVYTEQLIELLSQSSEFEETEKEKNNSTEEEIDKLWVKVLLEAKNYGLLTLTPEFENRSIYKTYVLIHTHLFRVQLTNKDLLAQRSKIISQCVGILHGLAEVIASYGWIISLQRCIELSQMIVQAMPYKQSQLLQLPNITIETINEINSMKPDLKSVAALIRLSVPEKEKILKSLTKEQIHEINIVSAIFPILNVDCDLRVKGDEAITPRSIMTCVIDLSIELLGNNIIKGDTAVTQENKKELEKVMDKLDDIEEADVGEYLVKANQSYTVPSAYSPYFPGNKKAHWWIIIADTKNGKLLTNPTKVTNLTKSTTVKFQLNGPSTPGKYRITIMIKSDSYSGFDIRKEIQFEVSPDSVLPEESEIDDDISEPDAGIVTAHAGDEDETPKLKDDETSSEEE